MYIRIFSILALLLFNHFVDAQSEIIGKWKSKENDNLIEIYMQNNIFYGKIIKVSGNESKEKIGHLLLDSLIFNPSTKKYKGFVNSTNGMKANCIIELLNQKRFQLTVTKLFIQKNKIFIRTE